MAQFDGITAADGPMMDAHYPARFRVRDDRENLDFAICGGPAVNTDGHLAAATEGS